MERNFPENYFGHFGISCKVVLKFWNIRKIPSHRFISGHCLHFGTISFDVIGFERPHEIIEILILTQASG